MARKVAIMFLMFAAAAWAFGCGGGGNDALENAPPAKPQNIGDPSQYSVGATEIDGGTHWLVVTEVEGGKRLMVFINRLINVEDTADAMLTLQYDPEKKEFYTRGREYTYNLTGEATYKMSGGTPGPPLKRRPVEIDKTTGNVLYYSYKVVKKEDRDVEGKGFVTVQ